MNDGVHLQRRSLEDSTWPAFTALVEGNGGVASGCWCMAFHPEGVGKGTTAMQNRDRKLVRVRASPARAALVFDGDDCMGWCHLGSAEELPRIKSRAAYERSQTMSPEW